MSPSLFVLGWMAVVSCSIAVTGRAEAASVLLSVVTCFMAIVSEAGSLEAGKAVKGRTDATLQALAALAFLGRLAFLGLRLR